MILTISIYDDILPSDAEQLEDDLADFFASKFLWGKIEDSLTGNSTMFPIEKEEEEEEEEEDWWIIGDDEEDE